MSVFELPPDFEKAAENLLQEIGFTFSQPKRLAEAVLKVSDFYIQNPSEQTPWKEKWCQAAQISYFLPLNFLRAQRVIEQGEQVGFFEKFDEIIDFGSGLGAGSIGLEKNANNFNFIESSSTAMNLHQKMLQALWSRSIPRTSWGTTAPKPHGKTLAVFSYSLTELSALPLWTESCDSLMIMEPATHQDGRNLLELREKLLKRGFLAWAPCTHQEACPLLTLSKTDWCHDRIHWEMPEWFRQIESHLPIKNSTLTVSYLLMSKRKPQLDFATAARLTGDQLDEKGKSRQLVCRGPQREFFAWLHRHIKPTETRRGTLVSWPQETELKPSEIRLTKNLDVYSK